MNDDHLSGNEKRLLDWLTRVAGLQPGVHRGSVRTRLMQFRDDAWADGAIWGLWTGFVLATVLYCIAFWFFR